MKFKTTTVLKKYKNDKLIEVCVVEGNLIVNSGWQFILSRMISNGNDPLDNTNALLGVGNGTTPEDPQQVDLQGSSKYFKRMDTGYPMIQGNTIRFRAVFDDSEANFTWNEWGIKHQSGTLINRKVQSLGEKMGGVWVLEISIGQG
jgi:hypothetical protein